MAAAAEASGDSSSAPPPADVCFGILGAADIARKNARAMHLARGARIVALSSRSLPRAEAFAEELKEYVDPEARVYGSYQEVLDDPGVDVVYIPLPTALHVEWVKRAAAAGKHVLCEKPPALSVAEMEGMLGACEDAGVQFMEGTMWVHNPRAERMREVLQDSATLGTLRKCLTNFTFLANAAFLGSNIRTQPHLDGLGVLGDVGWYCIRFTLFAFNYDPPSQVRAHLQPVLNPEGVLLRCGASLQWADGRTATFEAGFDAALWQHGQVIGTEGVLEIRDFVVPQSESECSFTVNSGMRLVDNASAVVSQQVVHTVTLERPQEAMMVEEMVHLVRQVKEKGPDGRSLRWPKETLLTQLVLNAVEESIKGGNVTIDIQVPQRLAH